MDNNPPVFLMQLEKFKTERMYQIEGYVNVYYCSLTKSFCSNENNDELLFSSILDYCCFDTHFDDLL